MRLSLRCPSGTQGPSQLATPRGAVADSAVYALIAWVLARLIGIVFICNETLMQRSSRGIGGSRPD
jgi:hypothetical protein